MFHFTVLFTVRIASGILFELHSSTSVIVSSLANATSLASLRKKMADVTVSRHRKLKNISTLSFRSTKYLLVPIC